MRHCPPHMGARRNFCWGESSPKKPPIRTNKGPHIEKCFSLEKRPSMSKIPTLTRKKQQIGLHKVEGFSRVGDEHRLLPAPPPPPAGAQDCIQGRKFMFKHGER